VSHKNTILQLSTPFTEPYALKVPPLEPYSVVPSGEQIKTILRTSERPKFPRLE